MSLKADSGYPAPAALQRRHGSVMFVAICVLLALLAVAVQAQTSPSIPAQPGATGVAHPDSVPNAAPAPQSSGATTAPPPDDQAPANDSVFVFKKEVQEVMLHATVVDDQRRLVTNLDKAAFTVYEDGVPQVTTSFHRDDVPVAMGIVIDNSGSMKFS
jgi:Ca-activated chloride channel family protein